MSTVSGVWVLASDNEGKLGEFQAVLAGSRLQVRPQRDFGIVPVAETGLSFLENAITKARHAAAASGLPAIADDSGLCVDALDGAPGIYSSRFAGPGASDEENVDKLLSMLSDVPARRRGAHFYCAIVALFSEQDPAPVVAVGRWFGRIATATAGRGGFGYDPVFEVDEAGTTAAQLTTTEKNTRSHRGQALRELCRLLALDPRCCAL